MTQEAAYLARIQEAGSYSVDGVLKLMDGRGEVVLTYSPVPNGTPVPAPLQNTTWYVNSFVDAAGRSYSPGGLTTIRLVFGADGNLYGNAGCNNHYGPYETTGEGSIVIGDQQTTRIYCGIGGVMEMERAYLALLPDDDPVFYCRRRAPPLRCGGEGEHRMRYGLSLNGILLF